MVRCALCIIRNRFFFKCTRSCFWLIYYGQLCTHTYTCIYIHTIVYATINIDNIHFIYSNVDNFPTINGFMFLQVVYPQMATNTTGKVNLGQEGKPSYYNCVLHVYALIKKIWKFNEKSLSHVIQNWWRIHQSSFYLYRWRNPFTLTYKRKR